MSSVSLPSAFVPQSLGYLHIHNSSGKLSMETRGKVCIHTFVPGLYGRAPGRDLLYRPIETDTRCTPSLVFLFDGSSRRGVKRRANVPKFATVPIFAKCLRFNPHFRFPLAWVAMSWTLLQPPESENWVPQKDLFAKGIRSSASPLGPDCAKC